MSRSRIRPRLCLPFLLTLFVLLCSAPSPSFAGNASEMAILPPALPWDGASRALVAATDDPWITPAEQSGFELTPSYDATVAWLRKLVAAAPELEMMSLGKSALGRDLWLVIASAEGAFTPKALQRSGKPTLLAQAGIHAGEIDGKDAGLMLLRDLTVSGKKRRLLDGANLLFVPIFNSDGHERVSPFGRMNQRGPSRMGWRTNARNLNLNRDYAKLDTADVRAMVRALNTWQPTLYVDLHVTDGVDYQYDITWGASGPQTYSPSTSRWLTSVLDPQLRAKLEAAGHIPGSLVFAANQRDLTGGLYHWSAADPRFSDAYGSLRHLPTILVENHSLKPYEQRVLGTYVLLEGLLEGLARDSAGLVRATAEDRARRPAEVPLAWGVPKSEAPAMVRFLGVESRDEPSAISGVPKVVWTGRPVELELPRFAPTEVVASAKRPVAYWIPPQWSEVIERLELHGIELERQSTARHLEVEMYRLSDVSFAPAPYEGHLRVTATPVAEKRREHFPAGSVRVATDQPLGDLAVVLLEPKSPDSFFQWGFFLEILQQTEYFEAYVMEPIAERMLAEDPELAAAFDKRLAEDEAFAKDPMARLAWFYVRTPFYDERFNLYPIGRE